MKHLCLLAALCLPALAGAQSVGIGTTTPAASAALEVRSTSQGLLLPRMTTAQMQAISGAESGLLIFNTSDSKFYGCRTGAATASITQTTGATFLSSSNLSGNIVGQSFSPASGSNPQAGILQSITAYSGVTGTRTVTVRVYSGYGNGGSPLGTATLQSAELVSGQPFTVPFAAFGIIVSTGSTHSFTVSFSGGGATLIGSTSDPYPNGQGFGTTFDTPSTDVKFQLTYTNPAHWVPLH